VKLIPLGAGGFIPAGRHTMSFLLADGDGALVLDAGTGMARLLEPGMRSILAPLERLDIVLSHYHLDHVIGLSYLTAIAAGKSVRLFAPQTPLVDGDAEVALDHLLAPPLFPVSWRQFPGAVELVRYGSDGFRVLDCAVRVRRQRHAGGSVGMRFGDSFAYTTDTEPDPETVEFVRGVDLLAHEVWMDDAEAAAEPKSMRGHSAAGDVARIASAAGVRRLLPVHHHPRRSAQGVGELIATLAENFPGEVVNPIEGEAIELKRFQP
jgi:ribonuclease BN (tRNA processing enzyme)